MLRPEMARHSKHHRKPNQFAEKYSNEILIVLILLVVLGLVVLITWLIGGNSRSW